MEENQDWYKKHALHGFLSLVDVCDYALQNLQCHPLCGPGIKGLREELLGNVQVPSYVLRAFRDGDKEVWENGWEIT